MSGSRTVGGSRTVSSATAGADTLPEELRRHLTPESVDWLAAALRDVSSTTADEATGGIPAWEVHFATAGRRCRPRTTRPQRPAADDPVEAARVLLLRTARVDADALTRLYRRGSAGERRAVLRALPYLPYLGPAALPLVEDALRTNDTRLVAAAVGPYGAAHLSSHAWRQAVLKCLFTGVPLAAVASLAERACGDEELARMLTDYAAERRAAGRAVPEDLEQALSLTATATVEEC